MGSNFEFVIDMCVSWTCILVEIGLVFCLKLNLYFVSDYMFPFSFIVMLIKFEFCGNMLSKIWILWGHAVQNLNFVGICCPKFFLRALSWYNDTMPSFRNFGDSFHILNFFKRRSNTNLKYFSYTVHFFWKF